jgi:hypothetical protein
MCSANINVHAHIYDNIIIKKKHMQNFIQKKIQLFISIPNTIEFCAANIFQTF